MKISYKYYLSCAASTLTAWLRKHSECDHRHSLMLRVLNTLNGRCEARPIRGVSSPVERLVTVCLRVEANRRAIQNKLKFFWFHICFVYVVILGTTSRVSPDARGWTPYLAQLGCFVSRQRSFLRKDEILDFWCWIPLLYALDTKGIYVLMGSFIFWKKVISWKKHYF